MIRFEHATLRASRKINFKHVDKKIAQNFLIAMT